jgi:hypothetical protein
LGRYAKEPEGGAGLPEVEPGNYIGRCYRIIELGTTHEEFQGETKARNRLMISFELPDERMEDGRPFSVTWWVTNSLHEKANLRIGLDLWRKRPFTEAELQGFDLAKIAGVPATVTVQHNKKGRANVAGVGPLMKNQICPPQVNPSQTFFLDEFEDEAFAALPDGIRAMVQESDEYKAIRRARSQAAQASSYRDKRLPGGDADPPWVDDSPPDEQAPF